MAVTYDAIGPASGAPEALNGTGPLTWTHTTGAVSSPVMVIGVDTCASSDSGLTTSAALSPSTGLTITSLGREETNAGAGGGYLQAWSVLGCAASTAYTVTITVSGSGTTSIIGASFSFANAGSFGSPVLQNTNSTWAVTVTGVASTSMVAAFLATGSAITSGANAKYNDDFNTSYSTGADAGGYNSGSGSVTVTLGTAGGVSSAMIGVEVQQAGTNTAAAYATQYDTTAQAGTGTWTNPQNAENAPDGVFAVWTAP
jgi:hypothetical protein